MLEVAAASISDTPKGPRDTSTSALFATRFWNNGWRTLARGEQLNPDERELDEVIESTIGIMSQISLPWSTWKGPFDFVGLRGIFSVFKSCVEEIRSVRLECYLVKGGLASGKSHFRDNGRS
jgi:hypothetical protein